MTKAELVRQELAKLPIVEFKDEDAVILCPFHDDHNPSLNVALTERTRKNQKGKIKNVTPGNFFCWSCKAGGGWNALAGRLGLVGWDQKEAENRPSDPFWSLAKQLEVMNEAPYVYRKPATDGSWDEPWRGLPVAFMRQYGAESLWDTKDEDYRIFLPVHDINQKLVGHVGARPENSTIPDKRKYINSYLFPKESNWYLLSTIVPTDLAVIVEGPFDTLRFRYCGIPAIGAYGVSDCYPEKVMQLLASGINRVVLCLDGDRAGREAVPMFTQALQSQGIKVADMNLSNYGADKIDPGNAPDEVVKDLKHFLENF
jgi:hypothetical protein